MEESKTRWGKTINTCLVLSAICLTCRYGLVAPAFVPQRAELWITRDRGVWSALAPMGNWAVIPIEIIATVMIIIVILGLFADDEAKVSGVANTRSMVSAGMVVGFISSIPLLLESPYILTIIGVCFYGLYATTTISLGFGEYDDLYRVFGVVAGLLVGTFVVYGGLVTLVALVMLAFATLIGVFCGFACGQILRYIRIRWLA